MRKWPQAPSFHNRLGTERKNLSQGVHEYLYTSKCSRHGIKKRMDDVGQAAGVADKGVGTER
ncbi:hypothetical protein HPB49_022492 [Dermacentor silvarum]|uniref:Uncharacterized protein n=1 Tax=Dermacentor silvarum TaxID=543639 RepID=A0ACB8CHX6_DERSI|nr:hypothetical protein HPB49_022492 [Dermacentor silvarum]